MLSGFNLAYTLYTHNYYVFFMHAVVHFQDGAHVAIRCMYDIDVDVMHILKLTICMYGWA